MYFLCSIDAIPDLSWIDILVNFLNPELEEIFLSLPNEKLSLNPITIFSYTRMSGCLDMK